MPVAFSDPRSGQRPREPYASQRSACVVCPLSRLLDFDYRALVTSAAVALAACGGGEDDACTTVGCARSNTPEVSSNGGGAAAPAQSAPTFGTPQADLLGSSAGSNEPAVTEACREITLSAAANPINVLLLVDRSTSMLEPVDPSVPDGPTRWQAVTGALRAFVNSERASHVSIGLQFFGLSNGSDDCGADKYALPKVRIDRLGSNRADLLHAIDVERPGSFTPTLPAVEGALRYAVTVAAAPENANVPTIVVLASDGIPSECGAVNANGQTIVSFREINDTLRSYSQPPPDASGAAVRPPIRTFLIGTEDLKSNAAALAEAGGGQAFLVGGASGQGTDLQARFLDALLSIVVKPLACELELPQTAPSTGEVVDFEKVRVRFAAAASGTTTEFPRVRGLVECGNDTAWYYDDNLAPKKLLFCKRGCQSIGAGDLKLELGCSPRRIVR